MSKTKKSYGMQSVEQERRACKKQRERKNRLARTVVEDRTNTSVAEKTARTMEERDATDGKGPERMKCVQSALWDKEKESWLEPERLKEDAEWKDRQGLNSGFFHSLTAKEEADR